jgi:hypothetical protein
MIEDEVKKLMEHYGIRLEQQPVYHYAGFRYGTLTDAVNYAERVARRAGESHAAAAIKPR